jgi:hypothetical protein
MADMKLEQGSLVVEMHCLLLAPHLYGLLQDMD